MSRKIVTIDPGHGGHDSGAVGSAGLREKDVVLSVSLKMRDFLAPYVDVVLTRNNDGFLELSDRAEIGNRHESDLFVSVHCNSADRRDASGFEVFTTKGQTVSDIAATDCFLAYGEAFPDAKRRVDTADGDIDKEAGYTVIVKSRGPALLFELEFISNPEVESWLRNSENQSKMAAALCKGILKFLKVAEVPATPKPLPEIPVPASREERIRFHAAEIIKLASD